MGKSRTVIAWLAAASTVGLVSGLPHVTLADDAGPGGEVRAIRHDLPMLLRGQLRKPYSSDKNDQIEGVVVSKGDALAQWRSEDGERLGYLNRRYGTWWLRKEVSSSDAVSGAHSSYRSPDWSLANALGAPDALIDLASQHLSQVGAADSRFSNKCPGAVTAINFERDAQFPTAMDGYQTKFVIASNDAQGDAAIVDVSGRAPTEAESWITRGGNSYFFFSGTVQSTAPIHVQSGTTIDVWFPFVLDASLYYGITIAHADKPIGPIDGTVKDNAVHFVLPAFALPPGATLMAEIEGDSFRHQ